MQLRSTKWLLTIRRPARVLITRLLVSRLLVPRLLVAWLLRITRGLKAGLLIAGLLAALWHVLRGCLLALYPLRAVFGGRRTPGLSLGLLQLLLIFGELIAGESNPIIGIVLWMFFVHCKPFRNNFAPILTSQCRRA